MQVAQSLPSGCKGAAILHMHSTAHDHVALTRQSISEFVNRFSDTYRIWHSISYTCEQN